MSSVRPVARPAQHPRSQEESPAPVESPSQSGEIPSVAPAPRVSSSSVGSSSTFHASALEGSSPHASSLHAPSGEASASEAPDDAAPSIEDLAGPDGSLPARRGHVLSGAGGEARRLWGRALAYVALTKPRIIELLLVTTLPTMVLAQRGWPELGLVLATLAGGAAAAGAANTLNSYLDRDIDRLMNRTRRRPLVTGEVQPGHALAFGYSLGVGAIVWLGLMVNWAAAGLTFLAILLYVVGYTILLKRRTPQNIVWGGAAGCMPVLIGWSAVTGGLSWAPLVLFGVIFFWTPPHYWPLSMRFRGDYAAAGVPMLPVVARDSRVTFEMLAYTAAMIACSLALVPVAGMGWIYTISATALGAWFAVLCLGLDRRARRPERGPTGEMRVFRASITYLTILFAAIAVDAVVSL